MSVQKINMCTVDFKSNSCNESCLYYTKSKSLSDKDLALCVYEIGFKCANPEAQTAAIKKLLEP